MQSRFLIEQINLAFERCECSRREVSGNSIVDVLSGSPHLGWMLVPLKAFNGSIAASMLPRQEISDGTLVYTRAPPTRHETSYPFGFQPSCGIVLTIHGTPNLSIKPPKPGDQNVSPKGMLTLPPAES